MPRSRNRLPSIYGEPIWQLRHFSDARGHGGELVISDGLYNVRLYYLTETRRRRFLYARAHARMRRGDSEAPRRPARGAIKMSNVGFSDARRRRVAASACIVKSDSEWRNGNSREASSMTLAIVKISVVVMSNNFNGVSSGVMRRYRRGHEISTLS